MKRIIPCLDVAGGRVVKGVQFQNLRDMGDPVELATRYEAEGADELVFLDIGASHEARATTLDVVSRTAENLFIPLTVGGGIRRPDDVRAALNAGADKVAINTAAVADPQLLNEAAIRFGNQCIVAAVDAKRVPGCRQHAGNHWHVFTHGGRQDTGLDAVAWCNEVATRGAGEILLTSMDADGTKAGYDLELLQAVADVPIPVIASGGCGVPEHIVAALGSCDAALAASIFHEASSSIQAVKSAARAVGMVMR